MKTILVPLAMVFFAAHVSAVIPGGKPEEDMVKRANEALARARAAGQARDKALDDARKELKGKSKEDYEKAKARHEKADKEVDETYEEIDRLKKKIDDWKSGHDVTKEPVPEDLWKDLKKARDANEKAKDELMDAGCDMSNTLHEGMSQETRERWLKAAKEAREAEDDFWRAVNEYEKWTGHKFLPPMVLPPLKEDSSYRDRDMLARQMERDPRQLFRTGEVQFNVFGVGGFGHDRHDVTTTRTESERVSVTETHDETHTEIRDIPGIPGLTPVQVTEPVTTTHHETRRKKVRSTRNDAALQGGLGGAGLEAKYFVTRQIGIGLEGDWLESEGALGQIKATATVRFPMGQWAPYVFGGAGIQIGDRTKAIGEIGGGVERRFSPAVGVFVDAGWTFGEHENAALFRAGISIVH